MRSGVDLINHTGNGVKWQKSCGRVIYSWAGSEDRTNCPKFGLIHQFNIEQYYFQFNDRFSYQF